MEGGEREKSWSWVGEKGCDGSSEEAPEPTVLGNGGWSGKKEARQVGCDS